MTDINYIGEHLLFGQIGHFLIITSFATSALACFALFKSFFSDNDQNWYNTGKWAFITHGSSLIMAMGIILFIMVNKYYEYHYVWTHVNDELPFRYIFSAFWEGQEGSFLLWSFWHVILGFFVIWRKNKWTPGVLATVSLVQFLIVSMLLGVYIFGVKIGVSPFALLRDVMDIPLFSNAQYLDLIDGNGLNPLLQNYWMTIHPPTTFLGFASLTIPFGYAIAGLLKKDLSSWFDQVLPWGLFAGGMLGTGILMGAAWAYEALSFGGYWAWDPVENSSLVPWLIMIAGIHTNLIAKHTGRSKWMTFFFYVTSFLLIVYSTFLTRSGVLGDTSVHAFTEMGLESLLLIFLLFLSFGGIFLLIVNYKRLSDKEDEEPAASREFWMFIGSLILLFSSILILFTTSIPVYNKLFTFFGDLFGQDWSNLHRTAPLDAVDHYNKYQLWIAFLISMLSSVAIFLRYRAINWKTTRKETFSRYGLYLLIGLTGTYLMGYWINLHHWTFQLLMFSSVFAIVANLDYAIRYGRLNIKKSASALAHLGFGIMMIGIMASGLNKEYISTNRFAQEGIMSDEEDARLSKNIVILKGAPMFMNNYWVTYVKDTMVGNIRQYFVHYRHVDSTGKALGDFVLKPQVVYDNKVTKVASINPSTKHFLSKDIFTHITAIPPQLTDIEEARKIEDTLRYEKIRVEIGDTFDIKKGVRGILTGLNKSPYHPEYESEPGDLAVGAKIKILNDFDDGTLTAEPIVVLRGNLIYRYNDQINEIKSRFDVDEDIFNSEQYEEGLEFTPYSLRLGDSIYHKGYLIKLNGFTDKFTHQGYQAEDGDVAVAADLSISKEGYQGNIQPVYVIRNSRQFSLNSFDAIEGIHARIEHINPTSELVTIQIATGRGISNSIFTLNIANNVPRDDYIVLEAIVFPGMNLFWFGSVMMMIALFIGLFNRRFNES